MTWRKNLQKAKIGISKGAIATLQHLNLHRQRRLRLWEPEGRTEVSPTKRSRADIGARPRPHYSPMDDRMPLGDASRLSKEVDDIAEAVAAELATGEADRESLRALKAEIEINIQKLDELRLRLAEAVAGTFDPR